MDFQRYPAVFEQHSTDARRTFRLIRRWRRFPVQAPFSGPSGEIMKTGNAPLRNGDFRRVAIAVKPRRLSASQASGRSLSSAFRERRRRFGTERPRPQMLVVAFDRPLDFLIEIKPPDGRSPACS